MRITNRSIVLPPDATRSVHLGGVGVVFRLLADQTGGMFSVVEHPVQPGTLVPPHVHTAEDEFSYVLEGEFGVRIGDQIAQAIPGCWVLKPRGVPHTFWNAGTTTARLLEIIAPAGFETYFEEMAKLIPDAGLPDFGQVGALASRYGLSFVDWAPELMAKYNLKLLGREG